MENFLCEECGNQLRINEGQYLFSYNIKCCNQHESQNICLNNILSKRKNCKIIYKCNHENKNSYIHCFACDEDICFGCYSKFHKQHKMDYLVNLNFDVVQKHNLQESLKKEKYILNTFFTRLKQFENQLHILIQIFKSEMKKYYELKSNLIKNITKNNFTYIDIENVKQNIDTDSDKFINDNMKKIVHCDTFLKRYEHLKNIFDFIIKRGKFIEEQDIKEKLFQKKNKFIIPINDKYFIQNSYDCFKIIKASYNDKKPMHDIILKHSYNFQQIILKNIDNVEKDFSLFNLSKNGNKAQLSEITIKNILNNNKNLNENFIIKNIKAFHEKVNCILILSPNKIIVLTEFKTYLYDDLFINGIIIDTKIYDYKEVYDILKLNENSFAYSKCEPYEINKDLTKISSNLYVIKLVGDFIDKKIFYNCGYKISYYSEKEKILISHDIEYIYLINIKVNIPELIQKIRINSNYEIVNEKFLMTNYNNFIKYYMNFADDDSIYFEINERIYKNFSFCKIKFLVQYTLIGKELREISRVEIGLMEKEQ